MISVLFVGLASHLRGGVVVWQHATETVEAVQRRSAAWDRLAKDLANAVVYDDREAAYGQGETPLPRPQFDGAHLAFFAVQRPAPGEPPSVRFVTYQCGRLDEPGGTWLWRTSQSVGEARVNKRPPSPEPLLANCQQLSVAYAYLPSSADGALGSGPLEWRGEWHESSQQLPRLLEVSLTLTSAKTNQPEAGDQERRRLLSVPSGILIPFQHTSPPS